MRYLQLCETEIAANGEDQLRWSEENAYGTSFPFETKRQRSAGWYFSGDAAFDLAVAYQIDYPEKNDPRPKLLEALLGNLNYEGGANPVNMTYLTGIGWKRQREIVHQYAQNDHRVLPPTGIPLGNLQAGFGWLDLYGKELGGLSYPTDDHSVAPYPIYDRWGDSFNLSTEFVVPNQARALGYTAWLMAQTSLAAQPWRAAPAQIVGLPAPARAGTPVTAQLTADGLDLSGARIVWEAANHEPSFGQSFTFTPSSPGPHWIEAEAQLPDGRRAFAAASFNVSR
jgi:hypothetical protein